MKFGSVVAAATLALMIPASAFSEGTGAIHAYTQKHRAEIVDQLLKLAAIADLHGNVAQLNKNAAVLMDMMAQRGL